MACRVVIAYKTALLGRGLQSLLKNAGGFEVAAALAPDGDLGGAIREHTPHVVIVESGALNAENAQAVFNTALSYPNMSVLSVSLDSVQPVLWRALGVVAEGSETLVDALRRYLSASVVRAGGESR